MNPSSVDIKTIILTESTLGLTFASNLFIAKEPDSPDTCVTIFDTTGFAPMLTSNAAERYDYPGVQIRVRSRDYLEGWGLIKDINDLLHGRANEEWGNTMYTLIKCAGEPAAVGWDEKDRCVFSVNYNIQRR